MEEDFIEAYTHGRLVRLFEWGDAKWVDERMESMVEFVKLEYDK